MIHVESALIIQPFVILQYISSSHQQVDFDETDLIHNENKNHTYLKKIVI